jgi:hypothetical protein
MRSWQVAGEGLDPQAMRLGERIHASGSILKISNKNINPQSLIQGDPP